MKIMMKKSPQTVNTPDPKKMYPTFYGVGSSVVPSKAFLSGGSPREIPKLTSQFKTVAIETALSCIISLMYNQVIGPEEHSKRPMKSITIISNSKYYSLR